MNQGPLVFLGVFVTLVTSWFGMIFVPQMQVGSLKPVPAEVSGGLYPAAKPGVAQQGAEVYRQQGCYYCHSQQVRQTGVQYDLILTGIGKKTNDVEQIVLSANPRFGAAAARQFLKQLPKPVLTGAKFDELARTAEKLKAVGAKFELQVVALGSDLNRGWGARRTVANDFLFERTVMLGEQRIGPDLTAIGLRRPDAAWHLKHLYNPAAEVIGSKMPSYTYLFEKRPIGRNPSPDALSLPDADPNFEIVPKHEAKVLVAYLLSMRNNAAVFEAPMKPEPKKEEPAATNVVNAAAAAKKP